MRVADFDRVRLRADASNPTKRRVERSQRINRLLQAGDLLLEKSGGGEHQPVGTVVMYDLDDPAITSNFVARLRLTPGQDPRFQTFLHAALYYGRVNTRSIKQTTGIQNLDSGAYLNEVVRIPPLSAQRAIAAFLDRKTAAIDALIEKKERLLTLQAEQREALIDTAVLGLGTAGSSQNPRKLPRIDRSGRIRWLVNAPSSWEVTPSIRLFAESKERAHEGDEQLSATQAYGVIPQSDFEGLEGRQVVHVFQHLDKRKHVEVDDFVISMRSFQGGLERAHASGCIRSSYVVLRPSPLVLPDFYAYLFKSRSYIQALRATSNFIRDGQDLNVGNFRLVDLPRVPLEQQASIVRRLKDAIARIDSIAASMKKGIALLREYRQSMITAAVTGQLSLPEEAS